ncbi:hypothetical protein PybrP1_009311 [[Pythium] brassicae (nom. inval.)]|nr:hypothetical protein PybrP1_009311 [[Pythium] brassicae (nom. inval.)]
MSQRMCAVCSSMGRFFLGDGVGPSTTPWISSSPPLLDLSETTKKGALLSLPRLRQAARLQRLSSGEFFLIVPRARVFEPSKADLVCAIDPGVHNFITLYDPRGRKVSLHDEHRRMARLQSVADALRSGIAREKHRATSERTPIPPIAQKNAHARSSKKLEQSSPQETQHTSRCSSGPKYLGADPHQLLKSIGADRLPDGFPGALSSGELVAFDVLFILTLLELLSLCDRAQRTPYC